jgi:hypothetical protein
MRGWRRFCGSASDAAYSCMVLAFGIILPCALLTASIGQPVTHVVSVVPMMNNLRRISDVILVIMPLCIFYSLTGLMFAFDTGRAGQISRGLFRGIFLIPLFAVALGQLPLYQYLFYYRDTQLLDEHYRIAQASIYLCVFAVIYLEMFMAFSRASERTRLLAVYTGRRDAARRPRRSGSIGPSMDE